MLVKKRLMYCIDIYLLILKFLDLDTPDYMMTFAGLVTTLLTIQLPPEQVDTLIDILADAFNLPDDMKLFLLNNYLPEVSMKITT